MKTCVVGKKTVYPSVESVAFGVLDDNLNCFPQPSGLGKQFKLSSPLPRQHIQLFPNHSQNNCILSFRWVVIEKLLSK